MSSVSGKVDPSNVGSKGNASKNERKTMTTTTTTTTRAEEDVSTMSKMDAKTGNDSNKKERVTFTDIASIIGGKKSTSGSDHAVPANGEDSGNANAGTSTDYDGGADGDSKATKKHNAHEPLPAMYLSQCHTFHTNPSLSSPHCIRSNYTSPNTNAQTNANTHHATANLKIHATSNPNAMDGGSGASNNHTILNKALKRKQRLAQYKNQTNAITNSNLNPNANATENGATTSTVSASMNANASTTETLPAAAASITSSIPSTAASTSFEFTFANGIPCQAVWAPNFNYCKNAELLAIASPLSLHSNSSNASNNTSNNSSQNHNGSGGGGGGVGNAMNHHNALSSSTPSTSAKF